MLLEHAHAHGFIAAITNAFAHHYPLVLRPQHIWLLILQAIAKHVDKHAEELRSKWVQHEGKKHLSVSCNDFVLGSASNNWASVVDGRHDCFANQIAKNTNKDVMPMLCPAFSDTSGIENIAAKI